MSATDYHKSRFAVDLQREISYVVANRVRDPRIPPLLTITGVKVSPDLKLATVGVSVYGEPAIRKEALLALTGAAAYIQRCVAERISARNFPRFVFKLDESLEHSDRMNQLLSDIKDDLD